MATHQSAAFDGREAGGQPPASPSSSTRDFAQPLALPELDISDIDLDFSQVPPPPSYDTAMTRDAPRRLSPPSAFPGFAAHHGPPNPRQTPYAPVDYQSQVSYEDAYADDPPSGGQSPNQRYSSGSMAGASAAGPPPQRPYSDPNDVNLDMANLRLTPASGPQPLPQPTIQRTRTMQAPYGTLAPGGLPPRTRSVTAGHVPASGGDPAASVYSLDQGMEAYGHGRQFGAGGGGGMPPGPPRAPSANWQSNPQFAQQQQKPPPGPRPDFSNPYYNAANDLMGLPPQGQGGPVRTPSNAMGGHPPPIRQQSMGNLQRTNTSKSTVSLKSIGSVQSMPPMPPIPQQQQQPQTESVGASSTRRRGGAAAIDVSKPPYTREFVEDYRNRMKVDPDPEAQFTFAKYLIEAAKKVGDEIAQHDPRGARKYRESLIAESLRNIKKLAEGKEPYADAEFFLANLYGTGQLGMQVDHEKAYYLYLMASKLNHPAATYRAAVCCELGAGTKRDPQRSVLFYRKAAAIGDTAAMYKLGLILLNGIMGHKKDPREALVWLRRAASQGDEDNPHALHELALLHERQNNGTNGIIPYDPNLAREYLTQAAQLGYPPSQYKLGSCHEFGTLGFPIDPRRSIAWYTRAAERGDAEAELALSGWYLTGSDGVLKQSDTEAYLWGRKAANKGLAKAEYAVGYYTEIGIGVKQDMDLARRWYMRAASQGNKRAMQRLAELNSNKAQKGGRPTRKDAEGECVIM